jgi:tetratricopeptide (TPR) repeat protein
MVHFVSGIYRYARGDYGGATREFQRFIERAGAENNVTLSTAYQYLAASKVAAGGIDAMRSARNAISDIQKAAEQTPYDANVFVMRALVRLGTFQDSHDSIEDLRHALTLDPRNPPATEMLTTLDAMRIANRLEAVVPGQDPSRFATDVATLHNAAQAQ